MMAWARYLMLVVFENFLQFFFRFLPLCVRMSYLKKTKKKKQIKNRTSTYYGATYCFSPVEDEINDPIGGSF